MIQTYVYSQVSSTMDMAKKKVFLQKVLEPFAVAALLQTQGRGRKGREWIQAPSTFQDFEGEKVFSSFAQCCEHYHDILPVTFFWPKNALHIPLSWTTLAVGCALYDSLKEHLERLPSYITTPLKIMTDFVYYLKLPNDIHLKQENEFKKCVGVLCETVFHENEFLGVLIGIGINYKKSPSLDVSISIQEWFQKSIYLSKDYQKYSHMDKMIKDFASLMETELIQYLQVPRTGEQLAFLVEARTFPLHTWVQVDSNRQGAFLGLTAEGQVILSDQPQNPLLCGDFSFQVKENKKESFIKNEYKKESLIKNEYKKEKFFKKFEKKEEEKSEASLGLAQIMKKRGIQKSQEKKKGLCVIDFGNSRAHIRGKTHADEFSLDLSLGESFSSSWLLPFREKCSALKILYSTVNEESSNLFLEEIKKSLLEIEVHLEKIDALKLLKNSPIEKQYYLEQLGADRALRFRWALNYVQKYQKPIAILAFGTATTLEALDDQGKILESAIFPGLQMGLDVLAQKTAKLPHFLCHHWPEEEEKFSTHASLIQGVIHSAQDVILALKNKYPHMEIVVTGGNTPLVQKIMSKQTPLFCTFYLGLERDMLFDLAQQISIEYKPYGEMTQNIMNSMTGSRNLVFKAKEEFSFQDFRRLGPRLESKPSESMRIDRYLAQNFAFHTREQWRLRVATGEVLIQSQTPAVMDLTTSPKDHARPVKPTYRMKHLDQLWLYHPEHIEPQSLSHVELIQDLGDLCIFNKPGNLVIHACGQYVKNTFIECVKNMGYDDVSPVHRLDRETSGLLVCARTSFMRNLAAKAFREGTVHKMYLAVIKGHEHLKDEFEVNLPIGPAEKSKIRIKQWVGGKDALDALTQFKVLSRWKEYALLACFHITGRTNQIRVHIASQNSWIVGDKMYHPEEDVFLQFFEDGLTSFLMEKLLFPRHMLHNIGIYFFESEKDLPSSSIIGQIPEDFYEFEPAKQLFAQIPHSQDFWRLLLEKQFRF